MSYAAGSSESVLLNSFTVQSEFEFMKTLSSREAMCYDQIYANFMVNTSTIFDTEQETQK